MALILLLFSMITVSVIFHRPIASLSFCVHTAKHNKTAIFYSTQMKKNSWKNIYMYIDNHLTTKLATCPLPTPIFLDVRAMSTS